MRRAAPLGSISLCDRPHAHAHVDCNTVHTHLHTTARTSVNHCTCDPRLLNCSMKMISWIRARKLTQLGPWLTIAMAVPREALIICDLLLQMAWAPTFGKEPRTRARAYTLRIARGVAT